jgi:ATP-dependent Lon protease
LKEKLLAALRAGIKTVLIPKENEKDLEEIPENVKRDLNIVPVTTVDEVLERALVNPLVPIMKATDEEEVEAGKAKPAEAETDDEAVVTH